MSNARTTQYTLTHSHTLTQPHMLYSIAYARRIEINVLCLFNCNSKQFTSFFAQVLCVLRSLSLCVSLQTNAAVIKWHNSIRIASMHSGQKQCFILAIFPSFFSSAFICSSVSTIWTHSTLSLSLFDCLNWLYWGIFCCCPCSRWHLTELVQLKISYQIAVYVLGIRQITTAQI